MKNRLIGMLTLFTLSPFVTFADGFSKNSWGNHMGYMGDGWGNHMGFMGGGWMMIFLMSLLIITIIAMTRWVTAPRKKLAATNDARSILAERYAKGEITGEEFLEMKKQLN
jgi:uncharacterized membrane protein